MLHDLDPLAIHVRYGDGVPHAGHAGQLPLAPELALQAELVHDPPLGVADPVLPFWWRRVRVAQANMIVKGSITSV